MSDPNTGLQWGTVADWVVAATTIVLAAVAVFQDWIRSIVFAPRLWVSLRTKPPDCVWVPFTSPTTGRIVSNTVHVRLYVENTGYQAAVDVEVVFDRYHIVSPGDLQDVAKKLAGTFQGTVGGCRG